MTLEQEILDTVRTLPVDQKQEILEHAKRLRGNNPRQPRRSGRGLLADLNFDVSAEDIDEVRREM